MVIFMEDGGKKSTGMYTADKYSNIYDMLGNCHEWTTEYCSDSLNPCVGRGGGYHYSYYYAACRNSGSTSYSTTSDSFRTQLYIK